MKIQNLLKSIFGIVAIASMLSMVSCDSTNNPPSLVGHWLYESGNTNKTPQDMELFKDGTGVCDGDSILWKVENKRFIIQSSLLEIASDYEVSGYKFTLTDSAGKVTYLNINESQQKGTFTDSRDGKKYGTVKINDQTWLAENLDYEVEGSECYGNDPANCTKYGRLYDWKTALNICPKGWHLPSDKEWQTLEDFAGNGIAGKKLKARSGWNFDNNGESGNGTDIYGFSALPGGNGYSGSGFLNAGNRSHWWSSTEGNDTTAFYRIMYNSLAGISRSNDDKAYLFSVRCIQD